MFATVIIPVRNIQAFKPANTFKEEVAKIMKLSTTA